MGYRTWSRKESDMTEWLIHLYIFISIPKGEENCAKTVFEDNFLKLKKKQKQKKNTGISYANPKQNKYEK